MLELAPHHIALFTAPDSFLPSLSLSIRFGHVAKLNGFGIFCPTINTILFCRARSLAARMGLARVDESCPPRTLAGVNGGSTPLEPIVFVEVAATDWLSSASSPRMWPGLKKQSTRHWSRKESSCNHAHANAPDYGSSQFRVRRIMRHQAKSRERANADTRNESE